MFGVNATSDVTLTEALNLSYLSHVLLILLNTAIVILGFSGNGLVLVSSMLYNAIGMERVDVAFLENLAITDMILILVQYVPMLITLCYEEWVLGEFLCLAVGVSINAILFTEGLLAMAISCYRLKKIIAPLSLPWQHPTRHVSMLWIASILIMDVAPVLTGVVTIYAPAALTCSHCMLVEGYIPSFAETLVNTVTLVIFYIPMVFIICANIIIFISIRKSMANRNLSVMRHAKPIRSSKAVLTISLICWVYIASVTPIAVVTILKFIVGIPGWAVVFSQYAIALNVIANPIIYTITNRRFANFVKTLFRRC